MDADGLHGRSLPLHDRAGNVGLRLRRGAENTTNSKTVLSKFPVWLYTMQLAMERDGQPGSPPIVP